MDLDQQDLIPEIPTPEDASLRKLFNIWQRFQTLERPVPRKSDVVPFPIAQCLSKVWLYRHLPRQEDFECRVVGEEVLRAWKIRIGQGDRLRDIEGGIHYDAVYPRWCRVVTEPCIMLAFNRHGGGAVPAERLALPLADDNDQVCYVLGITQFANVDEDLAAANPDTDEVQFYRINMPE